MAAGEFTLQRSWARHTTIGFLGATTPKVWSNFVAAFDERLRALGWIDGSNIAINRSWADGREDRYPALAKDLVGRAVDIIVTSGTPAVLAAKQQTKKIPIVFASAGDPVRTKIAASLNKPGGNITGLSNVQPNLAGRRLDEFARSFRICSGWGPSATAATASFRWRSINCRSMPAGCTSTPSFATFGNRGRSAPPSSDCAAKWMRSMFAPIRCSPPTKSPSTPPPHVRSFRPCTRFANTSRAAV